MKDMATIIEECYECWLAQLFHDFYSLSLDNWPAAMSRLQKGLQHAKMCREALWGIGEDLILTFKEKAMAQKTKLKMSPTVKGGKSAVMPGVKWSTASAGIQFVVVDANGTPVGTIDPTTVTTTLTVDN